MTFSQFLACGALACAAGAAHADHLLIAHRQPADSRLELGAVTLDDPGSIEVYSYAGGVQGELLAEAPLHGGANLNVTVEFRMPPVAPVLVVLTEGGQAVDATVVTFGD